MRSLPETSRSHFSAFPHQHHPSPEPQPPSGPQPAGRPALPAGLSGESSQGSWNMLLNRLLTSLFWLSIAALGVKIKILNKVCRALPKRASANPSASFLTTPDPQTSRLRLPEGEPLGSSGAPFVYPLTFCLCWDTALLAFA